MTAQAFGWLGFAGISVPLVWFLFVNTMRAIVRRTEDHGLRKYTLGIKPKYIGFDPLPTLKHRYARIGAERKHLDRQQQHLKAAILKLEPDAFPPAKAKPEQAETQTSAAVRPFEPRKAAR